MNSKTSQKAALVLGVASAAVSIGNVAVKAGPALQTLNNLTNTAEFSINNTYGQSFSVDGNVGADLTPFTTGATVTPSIDFNATTATLITGFGAIVGSNGSVLTDTLRPVTQISATASLTSIVTPLSLNSTAIAAINLLASGVQTVGASVSSTTFGPSNLKATTSFTNQLINDLSAF